MEPTTKYHLDIVRKIFLMCGLILLVTLPFLQTHISSALFYSILLILILTFFAGITNSRQKNIIIVDAIVAIIGFIVFAYQISVNFTGFFNLFFVTNFSLAVLFLFAFYWSLKIISPIKFSKNIAENLISELSANEDRKEVVVKASGITPPPPTHVDLTEEQRRKIRFLKEG